MKKAGKKKREARKMGKKIKGDREERNAGRKKKKKKKDCATNFKFINNGTYLQE